MNKENILFILNNNPTSIDIAMILYELSKYEDFIIQGNNKIDGGVDIVSYRDGKLFGTISGRKNDLLSYYMEGFINYNELFKLTTKYFTKTQAKKIIINYLNNNKNNISEATYTYHKDIILKKDFENIFKTYQYIKCEYSQISDLISKKVKIITIKFGLKPNKIILSSSDLDIYKNNILYLYTNGNNIFYIDNSILFWL